MKIQNKFSGIYSWEYFCASKLMPGSPTAPTTLSTGIPVLNMIKIGIA